MDYYLLLISLNPANIFKMQIYFSFFTLLYFYYIPCFCISAPYKSGMFKLAPGVVNIVVTIDIHEAALDQIKTTKKQSKTIKNTQKTRKSRLEPCILFNS